MCYTIALKEEGAPVGVKWRRKGATNRAALGRILGVELTGDGFAWRAQSEIR
jgi:hypothetical protein